MKRIALLLIRGYRFFLSPLIPRACRFYPSCSSYAMVAIERHGFVLGAYLSARRLLCCHPFHSGGYDPVPKSINYGK